MADAEHKRLDKDRPPGAACDRPKLLLKIAAKGEFLTKSSRESNRYPHQALKNSLGKKSLRGIRSAAQNVSVHQAEPQCPEPCAQSDVSYHIFRRCPSAANKIAQTHSA